MISSLADLALAVVEAACRWEDASWEDTSGVGVLETCGELTQAVKRYRAALLKTQPARAELEALKQEACSDS